MTKSTREKPAGKQNRASGFAAIGICVLIAAILALTVRSFGFQLVVVRSSAMGQTLMAGDIVLLSRTAMPERGRIVYASALNGSVFRRVIGEPGDQVMVSDGGVTVNGALLYEPYALVSGSASPLSVELNRNVYLLLADNRAEESALVERGGIAGVAVARIWPFSRVGFL